MSKSSINPIHNTRQTNNINTGESEQLITQINDHVDPYELDQLFYGSHSSAQNQVNQPVSMQSNAPSEMTTPSKKSFIYKCDFCNRVFKEASHFSKHKRGGLCYKRAHKIAIKSKKKKKAKCKEAVVVSTAFKPYQCNLCGSKFFDKVNVELHLERTHQTQQPLWTGIEKAAGVTCSECDLWFCDKVQLKQHKTQQHNEDQNHDNFQQNNLNHSLVSPQYYPGQPISHMPHTFNPQPYHQIAPTLSQHQPIYQVAPHIVGSANIPPPSSEPLAPHSSSQIMNPVPTHQSNGTNSYTNFSLSSSQPSTANSIINPKPQKLVKNDRCSNSRWNICGECGLKFVEPINLELHLQRKHPNSNITETVGLSGGITVYKTNKSGKNVDFTFKDIYDTELNKDKECNKCSFRTNSATELTKHVQYIHNESVACKEFGNPVEPSSESNSKKHKLQKKKNSLNLNVKSNETVHKCNLCEKRFSSKAEVVRHRVKDKNVLCGVCSFSSCSNSQVTKHMYSSHKEGDDTSTEISSPVKITDFSEQTNAVSPTESSTNQREEMSMNEGQTMSSLNKEEQPSRLYCCMCNFYAESGVSLAQHLESHGSVHVKCGKCGESSSSFIDLNNHINLSHCGEIVRVTLTTKASHTPSVYMFLITPKNLNNSNSSNSGIMQNLETIDKLNNSTDSDKSINSNVSIQIYACSVCGACLTSQYELETHLLFHQNSAVGTAGSVNTSVTYQETSAAQSPLLHTENTVEFRCEECGFWREQSDSVIRHIQSVHMSAKMVHSQREPSGQITGLTIHVFTPLSAMVSS